jgi:CheY-like chemotaxis protein
MRSGTIFYCDDDEDDLLLFKEIVKGINPAIECVLESNSDQAMQVLGSHKPDLIFLDINIPKTNGLDLLDWIKLNDDIKSVPVVMYTTSVNPKDAEKCLSKGAHLVLSKPFNLHESATQLKKTIAALMPQGIKK